MTKYHINYEGKILPCRARVKKCPYGSARHADSYEELYERAMEDYSNAKPPENVAQELEAGEILSGMHGISDELETSKAPIELMLATIDLARKKADNDVMPSYLVNNRKKIIEKAAEAIEAARLTVNPHMGLTPEMVVEARELAEKRSKSRGFFERKKYVNDKLAAEKEQEVKMMKDKIDEIARWEKTHSQNVVDQETKRNYKKALEIDYNNYSKALNTSKLITQPDWTNTERLEQVNENIQNMTDQELLSMYDDLTISDTEIRKNLNDINFFRYNRRSDLSDKANDNIEAWYNRNNERARKFVLRSSGRILLSMRVAKELTMRDVRFGDVIRASNEREE